MAEPFGPDAKPKVKQKPLTEEEIEALEHTFLGPTWRKKDDGKWFLPKFTLGWQIAAWCTEYLNGEELDEHGKPLPWRFTNEQLRFLLWWYAVDERGRFVYRTGVLQRLKGWGKDPLLAVICLVEFVGPSRFSHFDPTVPGGCVGKAHPQAWVQIAAVSRDQTKNTVALFPTLMSDRFRTDFRVKPGEELIRANGGRQRLEAVTSNYRSLEGARSTFVVLNETHHWVAGNGGHKMYETVDGNTTKKNSRYLAITNAYLPGEDSVAERMREAYEKVLDGRAVDVGTLYDSVEAHPKTPMTPEALRIVLPKIRGDAVWLNVDSILQSIQNLSISISRSRRMWLNQIVADEDAVYEKGDWDPLEVKGAILKSDDEIVMGFDGGKSDDATALVAIRISDLCAFTLGVWERPEAWPSGPDAPKWYVPKDQVVSAVHDAFRVYTVRGFYADVSLWESYIEGWETTYGEKLAVKVTEHRPIAWDMRNSEKRNTLAHERLMRKILDGLLRHDGDRDMRRHVLNARRRVNNYGVSFGKESRESPRKVDIYAALMLAHEALVDFLTRGKKPEPPRTAQGWFM